MVRVVSLLPAATEILALAGGAELLVGRGHEDDYPASITDRPIVTHARYSFTNSQDIDEKVTSSLSGGEGLYLVDEELLRSLKPTVILSQSLCSVCAIDANFIAKIAASMDPAPRIVSLSPMTVEDIVGDVEVVGREVGLAAEGAAAAAELRARITAARAQVPPPGDGPGPSVLFMEWTTPVFCGGHWTPQLIEMAGGTHPLNPTKKGGGAGESFRVTPEQIMAVDPDWIIVCPCGLDIPTTEKELIPVVASDWWKGMKAVASGRVVIVDGNQMFNRSGPRVVDALEWLVGLFHEKPEMIPPSFPWKRWQ